LRRVLVGLVIVRLCRSPGCRPVCFVDERPKATHVSHGLIDERPRAGELTLAFEGFAALFGRPILELDGADEVPSGLRPFGRQPIGLARMKLVPESPQARRSLEGGLGLENRVGQYVAMRNVFLERVHSSERVAAVVGARRPSQSRKRDRAREQTRVPQPVASVLRGHARLSNAARHSVCQCAGSTLAEIRA
jgi:hypothetical protein